MKRIGQERIRRVQAYSDYYNVHLKNVIRKSRSSDCITYRIPTHRLNEIDSEVRVADECVNFHVWIRTPWVHP